MDYSIIKRPLTTSRLEKWNARPVCFGSSPLPKKEPIAFFQFSFPSPASLRKSPTVVIQKFCYHGNVSSHFSSL